MGLHDHPRISHKSHISVYVHATVLEVVTDDEGRSVTRVRVANSLGREFTVGARHFVLATNALENARLLLASDRVQAGGVGNKHGLVGRYFMDHPCFVGGLWHPSNKRVFDELDFYDRRPVRGTFVMGMFTLSDETVRREGIMNVLGHIRPRRIGFQSRPRKSLTRLGESVRRRQLSRETISHARCVAGGALELAAMARERRFHDPPHDEDGWSRQPDKRKRFGSFQLLLLAEQVPRAENRLQLCRERDHLGQRRLQLDWTWRSEVDFETVKRARQIFKEEFESSGHGRLDIGDPAADPILAGTSAHHMMGTTRMHPDPVLGVVDENCRVHGTTNLFVAGASVFPTGGQANPALTIVALSVRLADELKRNLE